MNLSEYQKKARDLAVYLEIENSKILYPALGLIGECGEVAGKVKKLIRDDGWNMGPNRKRMIAKELGDCCWYLANICCDTNLDLDMMYEMKGAFITHQIRKLMLPQLVFHLNRHANLIAEILEQLYYVNNYRLSDLPMHLSHIIVCIEEIARKCDLTLKDIYTANIENLLGRRERGTLRGEGDNR